jgi:hypothetical protein
MEEFILRFEKQDRIYARKVHTGFDSVSEDVFLPIQGKLPFLPDIVANIEKTVEYEEGIDFELDRVKRKIRRLENGIISDGEEVVLIKLEEGEE